MSVREATLEEIEALDIGAGMTVSMPTPSKEFDPVAFATGVSRSIGQGITFGFADEAEAYARSILGDVGYREARDAIREELEGFRGDYPFAAYGAEIAASMVVPGGTVRTLTKEAAKQAARRAAVGGAVYGAGTAEEIEDIPASAITAGAATYGLSRAAPKVVEGARELARRGVPLTMGQKYGGIVGGIEERLTGLPISDYLVGGARMRGVRGFERAAYDEALSPIGRTLPKGLSERGAYVKAEEIIGEEYSNVLKDAVIPAPASLGKYIDTTVAFLGVDLPKKERDLLAKIAKREISQRIDGGKLTGEAFKDAQSAIKSQAYKYIGSPDAYQQGLGGSLYDLADELTGALRQANKDKADRLSQIDAAYSRFKPMQLAAAAKGQAGAVTPSKLLEKVYSQSKRMPATLARGEARMQPLAETGVDVLGTKIGDPGTAGRFALFTSLAGGGSPFVGVDPITTLGGVAGLGALYSRGGQAVMTGGKPSVGRFRSPLEVPGLVGISGGLMRQPASGALLAEQFPQPDMSGLLGPSYP